MKWYDTLGFRRGSFGPINEIHKKYGLWIMGGNGGNKSSIDGFLSCPPRTFSYYSISQMYAGRGRLVIENSSETDVQPGDYIIVTPDVCNRYGGYGGDHYIEDNLTFCGPIADMLVASGVVYSGLFRLSSVREILPIIQLVRDPAVDAQIQAAIALQNLLIRIYLARRQNRPDTPMIDHLLNEIKTHINRWWTVQEMAEMCNLSEDQFRRVFQNHTGELPKHYLDKLKLRHAAQMLLETRRPITEIALKLGYMDRYHFSRRFKAVIGLAPDVYRRKMPRDGELSGNS